MKIKIINLGLLCLSLTSITLAQETPIEVKFRRSSLHTMVIESEKFPQKEVVLNAFNSAPFPEKYNDHSIGEKSFDPVNYTLTSEEKLTIYNPSKAGILASSEIGILTDSVAKELPYRIQKYLSKEKISNKLVAEWFNRKEDGSFDWNLVAERGLFNASFLETMTAQSASDGEALLKTAGFELIENTFVVINKFNYYSNEPIAALARDSGKDEVAKSMAGQPKMLIDRANKSLDAVYEKTKEGYSVLATSYLYKLIWNDSISNIFFSDMYMEKDKLDTKKKEAFDNSDLFQLEYVGSENATGLVTFSMKENRTEEQIITLSTIRIIDNVYSKLQKKYDVFKTKTPLYTGSPITAKIGTKEGLEGGETFEVLEQNIDIKTGIATYKRIGTIKVNKDLIWDNTYNEGVEPVAESNIKGKEAKQVIDRTTFEGSNKLYSGLLIKQIK